MLVDMEHHSALMSLNMSPFNMSPSGSPSGGGGGPQPPTGANNGANTPVGGAASMTTTSNSPSGGGGGTNIPPPLYGSPPLTNYNSCQQQSAMQPPNQPPKQHQQGVMNNLDSYYLFYSGGGSLPCTEMGGASGYPASGPGVPQGPGGPESGSSSDMTGMGDPPDTKYPIAPSQMPGIGDPPDTKFGLPPGQMPGIGDPPDTKYGFEELCPVCGDKVSGYHYGLLTCESCKGFFKRTVQNKKVYTCVADRSCHIDKTQRKRCPFCRFQKCLNVGMKLEAVRADRMRGGRNKFGPMYKRDRARKLQIMRQRQLAIQTIRGSLGEGGLQIGYNSPPGTSPFTNLHIKQEIQIPQVSSLTSSPDSSTSPIAVALGQVAAGSANSSANPAAPALQIASQGSGHAGTSSSGNTMAGSESKMWGNANSTTTSPHSLSPKGFPFDGAPSGAPGGSTGTSSGGGGGNSNTSTGANSGGGAPSYKISPLIREFVNAVDDREWQNSLFSLLQNQTYNQCEVDLFELMCKVLDQNLFSQVDWARNSVFFKDLKVDDQMKLLQHSWSDMLVLDHMHHRMHNNLPDETTLPNGQKFDLLCLGLLGVPSLADMFNDLTAKLQELKFDVADYICVKFLLLLNPEVRGISNRKHVQEGYEQIQMALHEYTITCYPQIQDKFVKLLMVLPDIHAMASRGEDHLYHKHCNGSAPTQTLLMEMLHAKRK